MRVQHLGLPYMRGAGRVLSARLIDALGIGLFAPVSLLYFHRVVGLPLPTVGLALGVATAIGLPVVPLTGVLVDRFGARRVVSAAELLQGFGFLGYLVVTSVPGLIGAAVLAAAGQRMFWSAYFTLVADIAAPDERDRWFGLAGAAQNAGFGVGGLLAAAVLAHSGAAAYRLVVAGDGVSFFLAASLLFLSGETTRRAPSAAAAPGGYGTLLRDRPFLALIAVNSVFALCSILLGVGVPIYAVEALHAPGWAVGLLFALNTAALAGAQTLTVRLLESHRRTRALALAGVLWAGWCVLSALALGVPRPLLVPYLVLTIGLYTAAELVHAPTSNALAAGLGTAALRGRYLAAFQFSFSIAGIIAPILFTALFALRPALPWLVVGGLSLVAALGVMHLEARLPAAAVRRVGPAPVARPAITPEEMP